ncbi:MAG: SH3 domain-containing protein [Treponema sp.]|nr:SH3 domain-containing protein [Treponema sp.]
MKHNWFIIAVIIFLLVSCNNKKADNNISVKEELINDISIIETTEITETIEIIENDNNEEIIETIDEQNFLLAEFDPKFILLNNNNIYERPDIQSRRTFFITSGDLIEVLEYGKYEKINEENKQWVKIRNGNYTGWCFITDVKELKQPIIYNPMNRIDVEYIFLYDINGGINLRFAGRGGSIFTDYGITRVSVSYNRNDGYEDEEEIYYSGYGPKYFRKMELCIENDVDVFPSIYFGTHQIKKIINGITLVDTFMFAAHESENQSVWRVLYLTTNKYDITIRFLIAGPDYDNELIKQIMREAPEYFKLNRNEIYNGEDPKKNNVTWDYRNDAVNRFGNDLRNGIHPSKTLNQWYNDTNRVLAGLRIY